MRCTLHDHRNARNLFDTEESFTVLYQEIIEVLDGITDEDIIDRYNANTRESKKVGLK